MKRSHRVVLTIMGTAAVGAVSMGFVPRLVCPPGYVPIVIPGPDGVPVATCSTGYGYGYGAGITYGGFGGGPYYRGGYYGGG